MPIRQPFYLNANNLFSATAVFLDSALTMCAPDGFYSDENIVRELVNCILLPAQVCPNCCSIPCKSWHVVGNSGDFTLKYAGCGNRGIVVEEYPDGTVGNICVGYGDVPNVLTGNAELSININCGCCVEPCETWNVRNVTSDVTVSYVTCDGISNSFTVLVGNSSNFCIKSGTFPTIVSGDAIVRFYICDCIDFA